MQVTRSEDKAWIDSIKGFAPNKYVSSVHGAQARILQSLGELLTYEDLICYSGFAFRINIHQDMCPSAGHPCCGYHCVENSTLAIPWHMNVFDSFPWNSPRDNQEEFETETYMAIRESIDRGIPVHYGSEEDGLIVGYADEGKRWWCVHPYHKRGKEAFWHDEVEGFAGGKWPWGIVVWTKRKSKEELSSEKILLQNTLNQIVDMWTRKEKLDTAYYSGEMAYEYWIDWLQRVYQDEIKDPRPGMQGNGWCFDVLVHSRRIAGQWLKEKTDGLKGEVADQLMIAARHFSRVSDICIKNLKCTWDLALPPEYAPKWSKEMQKDQINRLKAAYEHDKAAVKAIENAINEN